MHVLDRLADKFTVGDGCWEWTGYKNPSGYGKITRREGGTSLAYAILWQEMRGPIPEGQELHHTCENKGCVNPGHLKLVTRSEHLLEHSRSRTHCNHGHEFAVTGFYYRKEGHRECRMCCILRSRSYYQ